MKRSTKIGLSIAVIFFLIVFATIGFAIYRVIDYRRGIEFSFAGYEAVARRDYKTALAKYDAAIHCRLDPHNLGIAYCGRGVAFQYNGQVDRAMEDLSESIRRFPLPEAFVNRGSLYERKRDLKRAALDYSEAIKLDPNQVYALLARGRILLQDGATDDAIRDFDEAVRAAPGSAQPLVDRGLAYQKKNYLSSAIASYESALRIDPSNGIARREREKIVSGQTNQGLARFTSQSKPFQDLYSTADTQKLGVKDLPPTEWNDDLTEERIAYDLLNRGIAAHDAKNYREAIKLYTEGLEHHPTFDSRRALLCNRGFSYDRLKMPRKAIEEYGRAISLDPDFVEAYYNRGLVERDQKQFDKAMADFSKAIQLNPQFSRAYITRAALFRRRGDLPKAIADYAEASRTIDCVEPEHRQSLLNRLAWMRATSSYESLRDGTKAVAEAMTACGLSRWGRIDYIDTLAAAYAEAGDFEAAVNYQLWALNRYDTPNENRQDMEKRLRLYRSHQPYRVQPNK